MAGQHHRRNDEADGLNMAEPFFVQVDDGHDQLPSGQR
jgi:hypothetical protein